MDCILPIFLVICGCLVVASFTAMLVAVAIHVFKDLVLS